MMFSKFTNILHHAVEALGPNVPPQQEFVSHWKAVTSYFMEKKDHNVSIDVTTIPTHLGQMLRILVEEEEKFQNDGQGGGTGPCMEYLLHHKIPETLYTLARTDCPPGMKQKVLQFYTKLLSRIRQPILPHVSIHRPVQKLVKLCGEVKAAPTETDEINFLCTVCGKLRADPYLVNFFIENNSSMQYGDRSPHNSPDKDSAKPASELAINNCDNISYVLVESLLNLMNSFDARVAVKSCEGLLLCASLPEPTSANTLVNHTPFCCALSSQLCMLYERLPKVMDPAEISLVEAKWGLDLSNEHDDERNFPGKRSLISFLSWLDYCDQLISMAHPDVAAALARTIRRDFLESKLQPALLQASEAGAVTATAHLNRCLRLVSSDKLLSDFIEFTIGTDGADESHKMRQRLIERCDHLSEELSVTTLKVFETMLCKQSPVIIDNLVLRHLKSRKYMDPSVIKPCSQCTDTDKSETNPAASPHNNISTNHVEDELAETKSDEILTNGDIDFGGSGDGVDAEDDTPDNIDEQTSVHALVNYYLCLVPDNSKSSYQMADSGYDTYLRDAHKQFEDVSVQCRVFDWPQKPVEEASNQDIPLEGPFIKMLLDKMARMLDQSYDINLQVTCVVSRLAMLPHPNIHEYLINPFLPFRNGYRSLNSILKKLAHDIEARCQTMPDFQKKLLTVRRQLAGFHMRSVENSTFLEGAIVLEEFCKELAAIVFVKHHSSQS